MLTTEEKKDSNFYDLQRMIYYDLPVLIEKIFQGAFANCECGFPMTNEEDMKFINGFIEETKKVFNTTMDGQKKHIEKMIKVLAK